MGMIGLAVTTGCAIIGVLEYAGERNKCRYRIWQLEEMLEARFDPPATDAELNAVNETLRKQKEWLSRYHVIPWAPAMPWMDLPMDSRHPLLSRD